MALPDRPSRRPQSAGFTLLELLVVIAIIAVLISVLIPAIASARAEGTKAKCLANLKGLGDAMIIYSIDDEKGFTSPIHPKAECGWLYDGEYEYGGKTGLGVYGGGNPDFEMETRVLNRYLYGDGAGSEMDLYVCPTDGGIPEAPVDFDDYFFNWGEERPVHEVTGTSYRLNNHIDFTQTSQFKEYFYGPYMRPRTRVPDPSTTVILEEAVAEVAKWNDPDQFRTLGWHRKYHTFNVAFVDGHAGSIYLAGQQDLSESVAQDYWLLRGEGWRMDCFPREPIWDCTGNGDPPECPACN